MAAPLTQEDLELYGNVLSEIKYRIDYANRKFADVTDIAEFESGVLQLRKAIELIALATLAVNKQSVSTVSTALHKKDWNEARKILRKVNPNYWPTPFKSHLDEQNRRSLAPIDSPYLSEGDAAGTWGFLSDLLHASNPFAPIEIDQRLVDRARVIATKVQNLLGLHTADLGNREHLVLAQMDVPPDGHVEVIVLNMVT